MDDTLLILFLLGLLQVIGIGLSSWALLTLVKVLQRIATLEGKFDAFPIRQIANNRHRIEQLERNQELVNHKLGVLDRTVDAFKNFCSRQHGVDLGNL